jgi:Homeodomain-like domain
MTTTSPGSRPPSSVVAQFKQAADMKAIGHSWASIAVKLGRCERTLRRWRDQYPDVWFRLMVEAYEDALQRVGGVALTGLSSMVSSKEHPHHWRGCQFLYGRLFQFMLTLMKLQWRTPSAPAVGALWREVIQQIEGMSEEELNKEILRYVDILRTDNAAASGGPDPAAGTP